MRINYSGHLENGRGAEKAEKLIHSMTNATSLWEADVKNFEIFSLARVGKDYIQFYRFFPADCFDDRKIYEENLLGSGKETVKKEVLIKRFGQAGYDALLESGYMINSPETADDTMAKEFSFFVPHPQLMSTLAKQAGLPSGPMKEADVARDVFLWRKLYDVGNLRMIRRRLSSKAFDLFCCVTNDYKIFPQINAIKVAEEVNKIHPCHLASFHITDNITELNYIFDNTNTGFQFLMSDIGDASTTIRSFVSLAATSDIYLYQDVHRFTHKVDVEVGEITDMKKKTGTGLVGLVLDIAKKIKGEGKKLSLMKRKYPEQGQDNLYKYVIDVVKRSGMKDGYGKKIIGAANTVIKNRLGSKRKYSFYDILVQLVSISMIPPEDIIHSTLERASKSTSSAYEMMYKDAASS